MVEQLFSSEPFITVFSQSNFREEILRSPPTEQLAIQLIMENLNDENYRTDGIFDLNKLNFDTDSKNIFAQIITFTNNNYIFYDFCVFPNSEIELGGGILFKGQSPLIIFKNIGGDIEFEISPSQTNLFDLFADYNSYREQIGPSSEDTSIDFPTIIERIINFPPIVITPEDTPEEIIKQYKKHLDEESFQYDDDEDDDNDSVQNSYSSREGRHLLDDEDSNYPHTHSDKSTHIIECIHMFADKFPGNAIYILTDIIGNGKIYFKGYDIDVVNIGIVDNGQIEWNASLIDRDIEYPEDIFLC